MSFDDRWPARKPKRKRQKKSSGGGSGTQVGMAWLLLAFPAVVVLGLALFIAHGLRRDLIRDARPAAG